MITIQYLSDIHLEFRSPSERKQIIEQIERRGDVLVLAGDIGDPFEAYYVQFLQQMTRKFQHVFLVAGNHEFYHKKKSYDTVVAHIQHITKSLKGIDFLHNRAVFYHDLLWVGTTLWTEIPVHAKSYGVRDNCFLSITTRNKENQIAVEFITAMVTKTRNPCVVMTHHLPSFQCVSPQYSDDPANVYFACNLDPMLNKHAENILVWIHGHTHQEVDRVVENVQVLCNPLGYPEEGNVVKNRTYGVPTFSKELVMEK